jgi:uncharacterized membrane-anchored protein
MKIFSKSILLRKSLRKVPQIAVIFWVIKLITTALGESSSDYLIHDFSPALVVALSGILLVISLWVQLRANQYVPWIYWLAVSLVAIFGTMAADVLHVGLGIPYIVSTMFFAIILALVFTLWHKTEKTLSIHSINTPRRELFYWAAVISTFALGTAAGDMTAHTLRLGYLNSGILFIVLIFIPFIGFWKFKLNPILGFWAAYILTRPLGASFADWFGKPVVNGGLGIGNANVSLFLIILAIILVVYLSITHEDVDRS